MTDFYAKLLEDFNEDVFEETPVSLDEFAHSKQYMGQPRLSDVQYDIIERGSQIYKEKELIQLFGESQGKRIWKETCKDIHLVLGKGSGKDHMSQIICAYIVYKLLCLKDPQEYFGKPPGDAIDIVNMALNAKQAKRVFFDGLVNKIKRTPWFQGKYTARMDDIAFDKNITVYSLHSSFEAAEGLNILVVVLDELDGFPIEEAAAIYKALSGTVSSRFSDVGKILVLSFPRSKNGYVFSKYDDACEEKEVTTKSHTFKLNEGLEDGAPGNEFTIEWEEEVITGYKYDNFFALKAATFNVNPTKSIEDYKMDFYTDAEDTLMRVCANPPDADTNAFFKNHEKLEAIFTKDNGWDGDLRVKGEEDTNYYIHIDLSKVHDRTVVALGHVDKWVQVDMGTLSGEPKPYIIIDLFRVWEPTKNNPVNHSEVMDFVLELCKKFRVELVTFDQWGSANMIEYLVEVGIMAEKKSLARPEYQEFALAVGDLRLEGPQDDRLMDELKNLVILPDGKIDHPKKNHNDISEAICGVIRNCVISEQQDSSLEVITWESIQRREAAREEVQSAMVKPQMPDDIDRWIRQLKGI
ncbi:terminase large subunit [Rhodococcus phage Peregrin]|nr:terminase large subunit [Rhodococcus phage Peregrin]